MKHKNPFDKPNAESMEASDLVLLFKQPIFFDSIISDNNVFVSGARGSGKSTILKYLEYSTQIKLYDQIKKIPFIGILLNMKDIPLSESLSDNEKKIVFSNLFNLYASSKILLSIKTILEKLNKLDEREVDLVNEFQKTINAQSFNKCHSISELIDKINEEINLIGQYISEKTIKGDANYQSVYTDIKTFHPALSRKILKLLPELKEKKFFFLIDEYDSLDIVCQRVLNSLIRARPSDVILFKIAARTNGIKSKLTSDGNSIEETHDYITESTDFINSRLENKYYELIKDIVEKRINKAGIRTTTHKLFPFGNLNKGLVNTVEKELKKESSKITLIRNNSSAKEYYNRLKEARIYQKIKSTRNERKDLSGFNSLVLLSSGNIRQFILLCNRAFVYALDNQEKIEENGISPKSQNKAIYDLSGEIFKQQKSEPEDSLNVQWLVHRLATISQKFLYDKESSQPEIIKYTIRGELSKKLINTINDAVFDSCLFEEYSLPKDKKPREKHFVLNKIFCPFFEISPRQRWRTNIGESHLLDKPSLKKIDQEEIIPLNLGIQDTFYPKSKFNLSKLPGDKKNRIFLGGDYEQDVSLLKEIAKIIEKNSDFIPIIVIDYDIDKAHTYADSLNILRNCSKAIFEVSNPSGALTEMENSKFWGGEAYIIYRSEHPSRMVSTIRHFPVNKYSIGENMEKLILDILRCIKGETNKIELRRNDYVS